MHYPRSVGEMQAWFRTDADCLDYLEWLRWPEGFVCPDCAHVGGWRLGDGRFECAACKVRTSVTAGTVLDRTRTPLTVWFAVCWQFASGKNGISALSVQRTLDIGSYQTAWAILHRLRSVLVRPGRDRLTGTVEVDETYIGGQEPGLRGGRQPGKKVLTCIGVEVHDPKGFGRCRIAPIADASASSLHAFVTDHVEPGSTVITDGWSGYLGLDRLGYVHDRRSQRAARAQGEDPGKLLPGVHRVASLAKRWLLGTHQGSVEPAKLPGYLNEFTFRFNRRRSSSRGLVFYRVLQLAVGHDPVRYRDLVADPKPKKAPPAPPGARGHPPSLDRPPPGRPWRGLPEADRTQPGPPPGPPRGDDNRDDNQAAIPCPVCGTAFTPIRRQLYCTPTCRKAAWRARHPTARPDITVPPASPRRAETVYQCPQCETRYLGQQWCHDCNHPCLRLGPGALCPNCDEPTTISDLTDQHPHRQDTPRGI
jgi:transposase-like protein